MNNFYIYKITHKQTKMFYMGQRKCPKNKTPESDNYYGSNKGIKNLIKQYGKDLFIKEILHKTLTQLEADKIEIELIWHNSLRRVNGEELGRLFLNHHPGGNMGNVRR